jgi:tetratricopeptide (TPR) repeat protein
MHEEGFCASGTAVGLVLVKSSIIPDDQRIAMSITRMFRWGIRVAAWATPHVQKWHRERNIYHREGQRHLDARNWAEAERHLNLALENRNSPRRQVELLLALEQAERNQGKYEEAEQTANAAIHAAADARNPQLLALAMDALAGVQIASANFAGATKTLAEIEQMENRRPKPDAARLAQSSRKLAEIHARTGRFSEAAQALERSVKLCEQAHGAASLETANAMADLGAAYRQLGNHSEAQRALRQALKVYRNTAGPNSEEAAMGLHNLALSLEDSGDLEGAVKEYERVLALKEQQIGARREDAAEVKLRLAALYIQIGREAAARELLIFAIGVFEHKKDQRLVDALEIMAIADDLAGRGQDAQRWREKAARLKQPPAPAPAPVR